jgi:hypothetical protein
MRKLPDPHTTRGLVIWSLLFLLFVESVWTINYLAPSTSSTPELISQSLTGSETSDVSEVTQRTSAQSQNPNATAALMLSANNERPKVNETITVTVNINTDGKEVDGTTVKLHYDPAFLEVIGAEPAKIAPVFPLVLK